MKIFQQFIFIKTFDRMKVFLLCYKNDSCQKYLAENLTSRLSFGTMNRRIKRLDTQKKDNTLFQIKNNNHFLFSFSFSLSLRKIKCPLMIFARVHYKITTIYFYLEHFICSPADKESHYFFPLLFQLTPDAMKVRFLSCDGACYV